MVGEVLQRDNDFLLDTGIIIRYLRGVPQAADLFDYLENQGGISVSAITYMEVLVGCRPDEEQITRSFFERVPPITITPEVARKAALLIKENPEAFGADNPRGFPDALIAATAWHEGSFLVTLNTRHFGKVKTAELRIQLIEQNTPNWVNNLKT